MILILCAHNMEIKRRFLSNHETKMIQGRTTLRLILLLQGNRVGVSNFVLQLTGELFPVLFVLVLN